MKNLLSTDKNAYKANLHCHTVYSDGCLTPEEVKKAYASHGYSIVAFTDHDIFIPHGELADESFLPLNGYEIEINENLGDGRLEKNCHLCFIALDKDNLTQVCLHRSGYMFGNAPKYFSQMKFGDAENFVRHYTPECVNTAIKTAKEAGFFVSYNHPTWSMENFENYGKYEGMDAIEMYNGDCITLGYNDVNDHAYTDLLRQGKRIACTGSDDNHNRYPFDSEYCDSFKAFTMIFADKLDYPSVAAALKNKDYYASQRPLINLLTYENGRVHIECSNAKKIVMDTGIRYVGVKIAPLSEYINSADFEFKPECGYFRISIFDEDGKRADSRAYFAEELE